MIKAVFFDLYHTLVRYEPPREKLQAAVMRDFGVDVRPEELRRPVVMADEYIYGEISRKPLSKRSENEKKAIWLQYQKVLVETAGVEPSPELLRGLLARMMTTKMNLVPFDDSLPALTDLKGKGFITGLISNVEKDISPMLSELALAPLLSIVVTSMDVGAGKPKPAIFRKALELAGVSAEQAAYVGDQYQVDVVGAWGAGMKAILLDRGGYMVEVADCPRIRGLDQLPEYL